MGSGERCAIMATIESYEHRRREADVRYRYRTPQRMQTKKRGFKTFRDAKAFAATCRGARRCRASMLPRRLAEYGRGAWHPVVGVGRLI